MAKRLPWIVWASGVIAAVGGLLVAASIVWQWGHTGFGAGASLLALGLGATLVLLIPRRIVGWVAAVAVVAIVAGGAVAVAMDLQRPASTAWDLPSGDAGLDEVSGRAGDVIVTGGRALRRETGEEVWSLGDDDATTLLVTPDVAVVGNGQTTTAIEPASGKELWRFPAYGQGIAYDDGVVALAGESAVVGLDIKTGKPAWSRIGTAAMECDDGPTSRFSPAKAQSALFLTTIDGSRTRAIRTADGSNLLEDVNCNERAFIAPQALVTNDYQNLRGFDLTSGEKLWERQNIATHLMNGMGETLVVDNESTATLIDSFTGETHDVPVPKPVDSWGWGSRMQTVWLDVGDDEAESLWNPVSGQIVEVPGADTVGIHDGDPSESTFLVTATRTDLTGEEHVSCWALSEAGALAGPYPADGCYMNSGVLTSGQDNYPLPPGF